MTAKLVLVRHGQSQWNLENRFTGWVDVPLSAKGLEEAKQAGRGGLFRRTTVVELTGQPRRPYWVRGVE